MFSDDVLTVIKYVGLIVATVFAVLGIYAIVKNMDRTYKIVTLLISVLSFLVSGGSFVILENNSIFQTNMGIQINNSNIKNPIVNIGGNINIDSQEGNILVDKNNDSQEVRLEGYPSDEITKWVVDARSDVLYNTEAFLVRMSVRNVTAEDKEFYSYVYADVGDIVEYQIEYDNSSDNQMDNVVVKSWLPKNGILEKNTTKLYNNRFPMGAYLTMIQLM